VLRDQRESLAVAPRQFLRVAPIDAFDPPSIRYPLKTIACRSGNSRGSISSPFVSTHSILSIELATASALPPYQPQVVTARAKAPTTGAALLGGSILRLPRVAWMALDFALVVAGTALGRGLFVWWLPTSNILTDYNLWMANILLGAAVILAGSIGGLYEQGVLWARSRIIARCILTATIAIGGSWIILHLLTYSPLSRRVTASSGVLFLLAATSFRLLAHRAVREVRRGLLVIGQGPLTGTIIRSVRRGTVRGYRLLGVVVAASEKPKRHFATDSPPETDPTLGDIPIVGDVSRIEEICESLDVHEVVVAEDSTRNHQYQRAALTCLRMGCRVTDETTFYETTYGEVPVSHIRPSWFLAADLKGQLREQSMGKRLFDLVAAVVGLILGAPLMLLVAVVLKLQGGGPVLYSQTRVGQGGRHFTLYKFRTMRGDAEANGTTWAAPHDPRVTPIGRFLRLSRLDELPQLWNILRGEMSVVGPRPERPEFSGPLAVLIPFYNERHLVRPGLTGWAQINYRYGSTIVDARRKLQLDLYYIKHTSLELDLIILLRTFGTFFVGAC